MRIFKASAAIQAQVEQLEASAESLSLVWRVLGTANGHDTNAKAEQSWTMLMDIETRNAAI